jgi:16S rRNA (guanine527-N7)-methyltransferase
MNASTGATAGVPTAAAELFGPRLAAATRYVELLGTEGVLRGLIGPRESDRLWDRHVMNSAVVSEVVPHGAEVVDVGSGAGLPGVPLALVRPDVRVTLLEPMQRRCVFLDEVVEELGLTGRVRVVRGRAPGAGAGAGGFTSDVAVARAVAPLPQLARLLPPMVRPGGLMAALRGSKVDDELAAARGDLEARGWRDIGVSRCGVGRLDEPTRVLFGRTARDARRGREAGRDQRARGQARST